MTEVVAAGKPTEDFRVFEANPEPGTLAWGVLQHYKQMRTSQTYEFVQRMEKKYFGFDHGEMSVAECFEQLKGYVDSSDPDITLPNLEHMLQTSEAMRKAGEPDWMQLLGLIHDMGKVMYLWGTAADGQ